jgi:hypothetical protein
MRRALSFLVVSILLLLIGLSCSEVMTSGADEEGATGCALTIAVLAGLAYVIWPVELSQALFFVLTLPLVVLGVVLSVAGFIATVGICGIELLLPLAVGLFIANAASYKLSGLAASIAIIFFLTAWLYFRKQQWRLVQETWQASGRLYKQFVEPIFNLVGRIMSHAEQIGEWVRGE